MALYLGSNKVKLNLDSITYYLNYFPNINNYLLSSNNYILTDSTGLYLIP